jgi:hypothetical protein
MKPTAFQAATPFIVNLVLVALLWAISLWIRSQVVNLYTQEYEDAKVGWTEFTRPEKLADLATWATDLGTLFSTVAVTAASTAVLLQGDVDVSLVVYGALVLTIVLFAVGVEFISPLRYSTDKNRKDNRWLGLTFPRWMTLMIVLPNVALAAYAFLHY